MFPERQNSWGWQIAVAIFLGGAGGGTFLISFILGLLGYQDVARIGTIAGPVIIGGCALFFVADAGSRFTSWRLFLFNRLGSSWMSRGVFFISCSIVLGLVYSVISFWLPWKIDTTPGMIIGGIAALFAFGVTLYTGCVLGVLRRVPLWNTPALPLLFIFSALSTGMAVVMLINYSLGSAAEGFLSTVAPVEIVIIILEIVILGIYVEIIRQASVLGAQSVRLLFNPTFIVMVLCIGMIIPLALLGYSEAGNQVSPLINSILVLVGGFFLRFSILKAGIVPGLAPS